MYLSYIHVPAFAFVLCSFFAQMTPVRFFFALLLLASACFVAGDAFVPQPLGQAAPAVIRTTSSMGSSYLDTLDQAEAETEPFSSSAD